MMKFEKFHKCVFRLTKTAQYFILWDIFVSATLLQSFARDAENSKFFRASSNMERIVYKSVSRTHLFIHWFDTKYELVGSRQANKYLLLKIIIPPSPFRRFTIRIVFSVVTFCASFQWLVLSTTFSALQKGYTFFHGNEITFPFSVTWTAWIVRNARATMHHRSVQLQK